VSADSDGGFASSVSRGANRSSGGARVGFTTGGSGTTTGAGGGVLGALLGMSLGVFSEAGRTRSSRRTGSGRVAGVESTANDPVVLTGAGVVTGGCGSGAAAGSDGEVTFAVGAGATPDTNSRNSCVGCSARSPLKAEDT